MNQNSFKLSPLYWQRTSSQANVITAASKVSSHHLTAAETVLLSYFSRTVHWLPWRTDARLEPVELLDHYLVPGPTASPDAAQVPPAAAACHTHTCSDNTSASFSCLLSKLNNEKHDAKGYKTTTQNKTQLILSLHYICTSTATLYLLHINLKQVYCILLILLSISVLSVGN